MKKENLILIIAVFNLLFLSEIFSQIPFAHHTIVGGGFVLDRPASVYPIDMDGDTDIDVLSASTLDNRIAWYENLTPVGIVNNDPLVIPVNPLLYNNYPDPFNPETTIEFDVASNLPVTLKIYDLHGRLVLTLVNERIQPGHYKVKFKADNLASGIYFYRIQMGEFKAVKKMTLIR